MPATTNIDSVCPSLVRAVVITIIYANNYQLLAMLTLLLLVQTTWFIGISGFVLPTTCVSNRRSSCKCSHTSLFAGFGRTKTIDEGKSKKGKFTAEIAGSNLSSEQPCSCSSGKTYGDCCGRLHHAVASAAAGSGSNSEFAIHSAAASALSAFGAEEMLRARYTAYKHGVSDFIIATTHPESEDYVKFVEELPATRKSGYQRWSKEILQMTEQFDYLGLKVVQVDDDPSKVVASVGFQALFRQEDGAFLAVEENAMFRRYTGLVREPYKGRVKYNDAGPNPMLSAPEVPAFDAAATPRTAAATNPSRWLFFDSETDEPAEEVAQDMVETWPLRPENAVSRWGSAGASKGGGSSSSGSSKSSLLLGGKDRPPIRQSSGGLGPNTPLQALGKGRA